MAETNYWKQPTAELLAELASSNVGLASPEAARRLLHYGSKHVDGRIGRTSR